MLNVECPISNVKVKDNAECRMKDKEEEMTNVECQITNVEVKAAG